MRRIGLGTLLWLVAAGWASAEIRFLDDRGEPIASPLEACFQMDLRTECVNSGSGDPVEPPGRFLLVRVEGPNHGPVSLRYKDLEAFQRDSVFLGLRAQTDASGRIVIPNLAPGEYEVFLASQSQIEGMIEAGSRTGYLQTVRLTPLNTTRLQLTAGAQPSSGL